MSTPYKTAARAYVTGDSPLGIPIEVFPVDRETKRPLVRWGTEFATSPEEVDALWEQFPDARVGLRLTRSPFVVLDLEGPGHGCDLSQVLQEIEDRVGLLPATLTATTSGGGRHLFFTLPAEISPDELAEVISDPETGQAIHGSEVKRGSRVNNGRYVLAPALLDGSRHDGRAWEELTDVAPLPSALLPAIVKAAVETGPVAAAREPLYPAGCDGTPLGLKALEGVCQRVAQAQEGNVNNCLHWAACRAGEYIASGHLDQAFAERSLTEAALQAGHGLTRGEPDPSQGRAITATIESGIEKGTRAPRDPISAGDGPADTS